MAESKSRGNGSKQARSVNRNSPAFSGAPGARCTRVPPTRDRARRHRPRPAPRRPPPCRSDPAGWARPEPTAPAGGVAAATGARSAPFADSARTGPAPWGIGGGGRSRAGRRHWFEGTSAEGWGPLVTCGPGTRRAGNGASSAAPQGGCSHHRRYAMGGLCRPVSFELEVDASTDLFGMLQLHRLHCLQAGLGGRWVQQQGRGPLSGRL